MHLLQAEKAAWTRSSFSVRAVLASTALRTAVSSTSGASRANSRVAQPEQPSSGSSTPSESFGNGNPAVVELVWPTTTSSSVVSGFQPPAPLLSPLGPAGGRYP